MFKGIYLVILYLNKMKFLKNYGFKSLWEIPLEWMYSKPFSIS